MFTRVLAGWSVILLLCGSALAGPWEDGVAAYTASDFAKALEFWKPLAEKGEARAQNNLGVLYEKGQGIAQDYDAAAKWYRLAAAQGNEQAKKNLIDLSAGQLPGTIFIGALTLTGEERWVAIASRQDLNEAIEIAKQYSAQKSRVVRAQNGWFAVVLGPYPLSDISAFRRSYSGPALPKDAFLAQGMGYVATVWPADGDVPQVVQPPYLETLSAKDVCTFALNAEKDDWETSPTFANHVGEAKRRDLGVGDCRLALGLPILPPRLIAEMAEEALCRLALNTDRDNWDGSARWSIYVTEAKRRALDIAHCRSAIGLQKPPETPSPIIVANPPPPQPAQPPPKTVEIPPAPANGKGATIKVETNTRDGKEFKVISIEGELFFGDEKRFVDVAIGTPAALVTFDSPGGNLIAGLEIGKAIKLKGFSTSVPQGRSCASACALAWLAGATKCMDRGKSVGFHAAYVRANGQVEISPEANAAVGAYLNQLGLPLEAILYITRHRPDEDLNWLTFEAARSFKMEVCSVASR